MRERITELVADPRLALSLPRVEAQELLVALAAVTEALRLAAASPSLGSSNGHDPEVGNKLISAEQLAGVTGQPRRWFYSMARRKDWESFTVRVSRGKLLFRQAGVERWLAEHGNR